MFLKRKQFIFITAAAAVTSSSQAWIATSSSVRCRSVGVNTRIRECATGFPVAFAGKQPGPIFRKATRVYSSKNNGGKQGVLSKIGNAVKSLLPKKYFGSKEEKQNLEKRKIIKREVSGGLNEILKDAPLGVRMMGKVFSPLMSTMASRLAETVAGQQRTVEALLDDARGFLMGDPAVARMIGEPILIGFPSSQSSSSSSINGKTQTRIELIMPVSGSKGSGLAKLRASQDGIEQLQLEMGGHLMNVSLKRQARSGPGLGGSPRTQPTNIIEAEIINKETK